MQYFNPEDIETQILKSPNSKQTVDLLSSSALELNSSKPEKGIELSERAYNIANEMGYTSGVANSLKAQATCLFNLHKYQLAIDKATQALILFDSKNDLHNKAKTQTIIADCKFELKEYSEALKNYLECLKLFEIVDNYDKQTLVLTKIGNLYAKVGDYRTGITYHIKAISVNPNKMNIQIGLAFKSLAELYQLSGKQLAGMDYLNKAIIIFRKHNYESLCVDCYEKLGMIYIHQKEFQKAEKWLKQFHDYQLQHNNDEGISKSYLNLAKFYKLQEQYNQAISMYVDALEKASQVQNQALMAQIKFELAQAYEGIQKESQALDEYNQALLISSQLESKELTANIHNALSMLNERQNHFKEALFHFKQFFDINRRLMKDKQESESKNFLFKQEIEESKKEAEIYRLKNVELASANHELKMTTLSLEEANREKEMLLDRLREQTESLEELVIFDGLTGLANRRHFDEQYKYEFLRAKRYGRTLSVALADIDFFKKVNDNFSHQIGDDVLKSIARIFKTKSRAGDLVARYGGEEFIFLFTETPLENAFQACEKIRKTVEQYDWSQIHQDLAVTISMGVANSNNFSDHDELVTLADKKLYDAKGSGRNQVKL